MFLRFIGLAAQLPNGQAQNLSCMDSFFVIGPFSAGLIVCHDAVECVELVRVRRNAFQPTRADHTAIVRGIIAGPPAADNSVIRIQLKAHIRVPGHQFQLAPLPGPVKIEKAAVRRVLIAKTHRHNIWGILPIAQGDPAAVTAGDDPVNHSTVGHFALPAPHENSVLSKNAGGVMDRLTKILGGIMIVVIFVIIVVVQPPLGSALKNTFVPEAEMADLVPAILTLLGGTVGGYITFAGAHRLIDAGITGKENLKEINKSSVMGIGIAAIVRVFLFLAVLGVVVKGVTLDSSNPAADAFLQGAGQIGYRFAGLVLLCAAVTSIVGAAYTSVSFMKTFHPAIAKNENWIIIAFIAVSALIMLFLGNPATLLVLAGAVNGLILPISLGICLIASKKKSIMGDGYHHPTWLLVLGIVVVLVSAYLGITTFVSNLGSLF